MSRSRMPGATLGRMFGRPGGTSPEAPSPGPAPGQGTGASDQASGPSPAATDLPEIPEDWRKLSWPQRRKLAAAHSSTPIVTAADAERAILAAVAAATAARP